MPEATIGDKVIVVLLFAAIAIMGVPIIFMLKAVYREAIEDGGAHSWGRAIGYTAMVLCYGAMAVLGLSMLAQAFGGA